MSMADNNLPKGLATLWPDGAGQQPATVWVSAPKKPRKYKAKWLLLWQESSSVGLSMVELAESNALSQTEWRVLAWIMAQIGIGNHVTVNQREVCRRLHIDKKNASDAVNRLVELGILCKGPKAGRSYTFTVSMAFCSAGELGASIKERKAIIKGKGKKA